MKQPTILAVETSADDTAAAVTQGIQILSSVKHAQDIHTQYGGIFPKLAKRDHQQRIEAIIAAAMTKSQVPNSKIDAVAVTVGPGLAIALEVGIKHAREWALKLNKPLVAVNHIEGHLLSSLANSNSKGIGQRAKVEFPAMGLVISGGHTQLIFVKEIGKYEILVESLDDNIGEAIDKGARMLGLPYPGGPALEQAASLGDPKKYKLPLPMAGQEGKAFSYSGLKTAFLRLVKEVGVTDETRNDLAAVFQEMVFRHLLRTVHKSIRAGERESIRDLLVGGGVIANKMVREKLDELGKEMNINVHYPQNLMLCTDNAAMIGVAGGFKYLRGEFAKEEDLDRKPRWRVG